MAPRAPKERQQPNLEEFVPYDVVIESLEMQDPHEKYGTSLKAVYKLDDGDSLWDFLSALDVQGNPRVGMSPGGQASRFRGFLNAVAGLPEDTHIAFFDPDELRVYWDDESSLALGPGFKLRIVGEMRTRTDGNGYMFRVTRYRPVADHAKPQRAELRPPEPPQDAKPDGIDPDDIPF